MPKKLEIPAEVLSRVFAQKSNITQAHTQFGISRKTFYRYRKEAGLVNSKPSEWRGEEIEILERYAHFQSHKVQEELLKRGFSRSIDAINEKRIKTIGTLQCCTECADTMTTDAVASALNVSRRTVIRWIHAKDLDAQHTQDRGLAEGAFLIHRNSLRRFIQKHAIRIPSGVSIVWLVDLLTAR